MPPRVGFFTWKDNWNKVLTLDHIQRRRWSLANGCCFCLMKEAYVDHILMNYDTARVLWYLLFSLFRMSWVLPTSFREMLIG